MNWILVLGLTAGAFTTLAGLPQFIKGIKSKSTGDLSLGMILMLVTGTLLWLIYGVTIGDLPIIITNAMAFLISSSILVLKLRYK